MIGDCGYGVCGDCNAIGVIHTGDKSEGKKSHFLPVTVIVVSVLVYGSYIQVTNLGAKKLHFWQ